jgi:hypothetical protein
VILLTSRVFFLCSKTCKAAYYCDDTCRENARPVHNCECVFLRREVKEISKRSGVNIELIRMTLKIVTVHTLEALNRIPAQSKYINGVVVSSVGLIDSLENHISYETGAELAAMTEAANGLLELVSPRSALSPAQVVALMCMVNCNLYQMQFEGQPEPYGMGVFPVGALFNHSCFPNTQFTSKGPVTLSPCHCRGPARWPHARTRFTRVTRRGADPARAA